MSRKINSGVTVQVWHWSEKRARVAGERLPRELGCQARALPFLPKRSKGSPRWQCLRFSWNVVPGPGLAPAHVWCCNWGSSSWSGSWRQAGRAASCSAREDACVCLWEQRDLCWLPAGRQGHFGRFFLGLWVLLRQGWCKALIVLPGAGSGVNWSLESGWKLLA